MSGRGAPFTHGARRQGLGPGAYTHTSTSSEHGSVASVRNRSSCFKADDRLALAPRILDGHNRPDSFRATRRAACASKGQAAKYRRLKDDFRPVASRLREALVMKRGPLVHPLGANAGRLPAIVDIHHKPSSKSP